MLKKILTSLKHFFQVGRKNNIIDISTPKKLRNRLEKCSQTKEKRKIMIISNIIGCCTGVITFLILFNILDILFLYFVDALISFYIGLGFKIIFLYIVTLTKDI